MKTLQERLTEKVLIADGSTGAVLMAAGLPAGTPPELWNVEQPDHILDLYTGYLDAGSQIILTNTFGGTRIKLETAGYGERVVELNRAAVELARQAAGGRALVAGDLGPTGELMAPMGLLTLDRAIETFAEQAAVLVESGVDLLWIETMMDLDEARAAVMGVRQVTDLPLFCTLSFGTKGRTMMGVRADDAARTLWPLGLTAVGANCGDGIEPVRAALEQMHAALPDVPLIAKPNAGLPHVVGDETVYDMQPAEFGEQVAGMVALGARVLGGCCGSTAAHINALAAVMLGAL